MDRGKTWAGVTYRAEFVTPKKPLWTFLSAENSFFYLALTVKPIYPCVHKWCASKWHIYLRVNYEEANNPNDDSGLPAIMSKHINIIYLNKPFSTVPRCLCTRRRKGVRCDVYDIYQCWRMYLNAQCPRKSAQKRGEVWTVVFSLFLSLMSRSPHSLTS